MMRLSLSNHSLSCYIRLMQGKDVSQVTEIDQLIFPTMRPAISYHSELQNKLAHYVVACGKEMIAADTGRGEERGGLHGITSWLGGIFRHRHSPEDETAKLRQYIFGFAGLWMMADEAHIINIAVREQYRRQGIGELLLIAMIDLAVEMKARFIVLEARVSNTIAQGLYAKYGFKAVGIRRAYYTDNHEDAVMMSTGDITSDGFKVNLKRLKEIHARMWGVDNYEVAR